MAKKKISTGGKIAIGAGVALTGYLIWDNFIKKPKPPQTKMQQYAAPQNGVGVVAQIPTGGGGGVGGLSPMGTSPKNLNWKLSLTRGMKGGEIESLQRLFNRVSKAYGKTGITVDGDYGGKTEDKKQRIMGSSPITLTKVYTHVKNVEEDKGTPKEDNIDAAYAFIITHDPVTAATMGAWDFFTNPFGLWD